MTGKKDATPDTAEEVPELGAGVRGVLDDVLSRHEHAVVLVRHSAREYARDKHDLENPLTDVGRAGAEAFGQALPAGLQMRGYTSPVHRCVETAEMAFAGYAQATASDPAKSRAVEGLGVFYLLDQMKMFRSMRDAGGIGEFIDSWMNDRLSADIVIPAAAAGRIVAGLLSAKLGERLAEPDAGPGIDFLVSHDLTLYLVQHTLLGHSLAVTGPCAYMEGVVVFERDGKPVIAGVHGERELLV